jgi:hypothetical protein
MTLQQSDVDGLTVVPVPTPSVWFPGSPENGVDDRLELARLGPATTPESPQSPETNAPEPAEPPSALDRIAVREVRHSTGPALLFTLPEWNSLLGREPDLVDLR